MRDSVHEFDNCPRTKTSELSRKIGNAISDQVSEKVNLLVLHC